MSDDIKLVITSTFGVVILAWVLIKAQDVQQVTNTLASNYSTAVGAIMPKGQ